MAMTQVPGSSEMGQEGLKDRDVSADEVNQRSMCMLDLSDPRVFETAVDALDIGVYLVDRHRKIVYWNRGAARISGYLRQDVTGRFCRDDILVHSDENEAILCGTDCPLAGCLRDGQAREATVYLRHRVGHRVPVHVRAVPLRDAEGNISGAAEIFEERRIIPESERGQNILGKHGCLDDATELPNREVMVSYLQGQLGLFSAHGLPFSVLMIQPDRLQLFRSTHGHEAVRAILRVFAGTMKEVLRATDLLGRWEGDQFLAILPLCSEGFVEKVGHPLKATVSGSGIQWWGDRLSVAVDVAETSVVAGDTVESIVSRLNSSLRRKVDEAARGAASGGA
jgi:diguanylate cyclase (GGDEF)-like protein/PAS domain S-box-containing protein